jgi:hypothetical protein
MKRTILGMLTLGCLLGFGSRNAQAELITFDDLSGTVSAIPAGYHGLNWSNLMVENAFSLRLAAPSPPNVAFSSEFIGGPPVIKAASPATFTFVGADFAGAAGNDVLIEARGLRGGKTVYDSSFTIHNRVFSLETLNFRNIDTLEFGAIGIPPFGTADDHGAFYIDNFTTGSTKTPEPDSLLLFGIGMAATGLAAFRRRWLNFSPM